MNVDYTKLQVGDKYIVQVTGCIGNFEATITELCEHHRWHVTIGKDTFKGDDVIFIGKVEGK